MRENRVDYVFGLARNKRLEPMIAANRDARALHLKLDELLRSAGAARNRLIDLENCTDEEMAQIERQFHAKRGAKTASKAGLAERGTDAAQCGRPEPSRGQRRCSPEQEYGGRGAMGSVMPFKPDGIPVLDGLHLLLCSLGLNIERGMGKLIAFPHGNGARLDAAPASLERFSRSKV